MAEVDALLLEARRRYEEQRWRDNTLSPAQLPAWDELGDERRAALRALVAEEQMTLLGIDCSNYQGPSIDWNAVKAAGAVWGVCKCVEGVAYKDPNFARNWAEMKRVGIVRGAYAFVRPDRGNDPVAEANYLLNTVGPLSAGDFLVLDIEVGTGNLSAWALSWLRHVRDTIGFNPWCYTGRWWAENRLTDAAIGDFPLWAAAYQSMQPAVWAPWTVMSAWQWTDRGTWPSIGACDTNYFLGDISQLTKLGKPGAMPPPPPPPTFPTADAYIVAVPAPGTHMFLRLTPRLDAPHGDDVINGERLTADNTAAPAWTTSWRYVRRSNGHKGYALAANLRATR